MSSQVTRRALLRLSAAAIAGLSLQGVGSRAFAQNRLEPTLLKDNFFLIDAGGTNVLVCNTSEGLVVIDSGTPASAQKLMDTLQHLNSAGVHTLFNTHWHDDQCGANEAIGNTGASIIAHQKTWHHLATEIYLPHEQRYHKALPESGRPTVKFYKNDAVQVGNTAINYGALVEPHTDGDIYVHFPEANILAVGGAAASDSDPVLDWYGGGWIGGRADSLDALVKLTNADTLIIPERGRVMTQAELIAERDMTAELYQRLNDLIRKGCSASCMQQEGALEGFGRSWQDPQRFLYAAYKGLWAHHYNLAPDIL